MKYIVFLILYGSFGSGASVFAQTFWGTDALGRVLVDHEAVGEVKPDKKVAMFYFLWHGDNTSPNHFDLSKIIPQHPEVLNEFDHPHWGGGGMYYWGEPLYGYYRADDYWVHLRSIQLLADAGVDLLVIDATNRLTYANRANVLMQAMNAVRKQGKKVPKIVFYTNTASGETMQEVYERFYKEGAEFFHPDCWFYLDGKPLVIGHSKEANGKDYKDFFTIRESQWPNEAHKENSWPWIDFERPQQVHHNHKGDLEIMNVSVAQHPNPTAGMGGSAFYGNEDNWGRSYRNGHKGNPTEDIIYGYNFQEQWDIALEKDPPIIFITGWNEWVAGKFASRDDNPEHSWFCDQADPEYSRDIEPTRTGGLKDHYYMQLVNNVRRFKGLAPTPTLSAETEIKGWEDWEAVFPEYRDYVGETAPRNHPGAQSEPPKMYTNNTGRNDFKLLKVARNSEFIYFFAQTEQAITYNSGSNWMRLYLDVDRNHATGWNGYDYRVVAGHSLQVFEENKWVDDQKLEYQVEGNQMMITIPRKVDHHLSEQDLSFEFKWSDNMQDDHDPLDWYINGDVAPGGRFNYIVKE